MDGLFYETYNRLSTVGVCDGAGGMECRRVYREWLKAGKPQDIEAFIKWRANIGPQEE